MKYVNVKYRRWSCQDSQKLQNNASSHYPTTIFTLCIYFLQYETPLFRIHVFKTRRLKHTLWLQNLNFKLGALRHEKRRGLALTSCSNTRSGVKRVAPGASHIQLSFSRRVNRELKGPCKRTQQVPTTPNIVGCCWSTMLSPFA